MTIVALTGGVACGKSSAVRGLLEQIEKAKTQFFNCDDSVGELLTERETLGKLSKLTGDQLIAEDGGLNRDWFRDKVFNDPELREDVEGVLHPLVLEQANQFIDEHREACDILLIEVPLLFEVDFPIKRDLVIVVGASQTTQIQRLIEKRNIDQDTAIKIIDAQLPVQKKIDQADCVIWNDGSEEVLSRQIKLTANRLERDFS